MDFISIIKVTLFLLQTSIGALANTFILMAYAHIIHTEKNLKPVDIILANLTFTNTVGLLIRGLPQIMWLFGQRNYLNDTGCKLVLYTYRVTRGVSICVTSFLSIIQAITLAPATARWLPFKSRAQKYIISPITGFWLFNFVLYIKFSTVVFAPGNGTIPGNTFDSGICYSKFLPPVSALVYMLFISGRDFLFVSLMFLSSVYILYVLKRHSNQVQYIHSASQNSKVTAERTAAKNIVRLVTLYVFFFGVDTGLMIYSNALPAVPALLAEIRVFISCCYALFSPFIIISFNRKIYGKLKYLHKKGP